MQSVTVGERVSAQVGEWGIGWIRALVV